MHINFYIGVCHIIVNLVLIIHEKNLSKAFHRYAVPHKNGLVTGVAPLPIILCSYGASLFPTITHQRCFQIVASSEGLAETTGISVTGVAPLPIILCSYGASSFPTITHQRCFQIVASSGGLAETTG